MYTTDMVEFPKRRASGSCRLGILQASCLYWCPNNSIKAAMKCSV